MTSFFIIHYIDLQPFHSYKPGVTDITTDRDAPAFKNNVLHMSFWKRLLQIGPTERASKSFIWRKKWIVVQKLFYIHKEICPSSRSPLPTDSQLLTEDGETCQCVVLSCPTWRYLSVSAICYQSAALSVNTRDNKETSQQQTRYQWTEKLWKH